MVKARENIVIPGAAAKVDVVMLGAFAGAVSAGVPVEYNLDENPSFETNILGVTVVEGTAVQSSAKSLYGSYSCQVTQTGYYVTAHKKHIDGSKFPVIAGDSYLHSISAQMKAGDAGEMVVGIDWYTADEVFISSNPSSLVPTSDSEWVRIQIVATAPATAAFAVSYFAGVFLVNDIVYLDGQEFRPAAIYNQPYIDGDQGQCLWSGTVHQSTSLRESALSRPLVGSGASEGLIPMAEAGQNRE